MRLYSLKHEELLASVQRNKNHANHLMAAADDLMDSGDYEEAIGIYKRAQSDAVMIQLQRMYHNPEHEKRKHGEFVRITGVLDECIRESKGRHHAGDDKNE